MTPNNARPHRVTKWEARVISECIRRWRENGTVTDEIAERLLVSYETWRFDWVRVASVALLVSIVCTFIAVAALLSEEWLRRLMARLFDSPDWAKFLAFAVLAAVFYGAGLVRRSGRPQNVLTNEALLLLGVLATAASLFFLGAAVSSLGEHFSLLLLFASCVYGALGIGMRSRLIWVFALLSLGGWVGAETGYLSDWDVYYHGMNYPLRFVPFGVAVCTVSFLLGRSRRLLFFWRSTLIVGLLFLFVSLWILSVFGNHASEVTWRAVSQTEFFHWSVLFALAAFAGIWHGLKFDNEISHGFGVTFLFVNLFTRYFEYFWDTLHKALFFAVLAATFWVLGNWAQRIWTMGRPGRGKDRVQV
jgi:hypothetical protein